MNHKTILKSLFIPLTLLTLSVIYQILWRVFNLPKNDELINHITNFFNHYGLWVILICSILESALLVGNFFPGGLVIFLSVIAAGHNITKIIQTVLVVCIGFFVGYLLDYILGKYGWYKLLLKFGLKKQIETAQEKLTKHSFKAIILSYWEVNLASVTATAAGVLKIDLKKFLFESTIALVFWNIFWGTLVFMLGKKALNLVTNMIYVLPIIAIWIMIILVREKNKLTQ